MENRQKFNNLACGASYFSRGVNLLFHPKLRVYILVPLFVNIILFFALTFTLFYYFQIITSGMEFQIPGWLSWAEVVLDFAIALLGVILAVLFIIFYAYSFNVITNIIAAPFYGLLAEKSEELITGKKLPAEKILAMVLRTFSRELRKLVYFFSRGIVVILVMLMISTIPIVNIAAPAIGLIWGIWSMSIQYVDYPADNHSTPFRELRYRLWEKKYSSMGLGAMVMLTSVVPLINIIAMPAAVIAGTLFWTEELDRKAE